MSVEGIRQLLDAQGGVASTQQVRAAGFSRRTVDAMLARGDLVRVRRGVLVLGEALAGTTPWDRRTLLTRAVGLSLAPSQPGLPEEEAGHALSHESALLIHGLPCLGVDDLVHLSRTDGARGRRDRTVWVHAALDPEWVVDVDGLRVVAPELAALQVAATHGAEAGVVALDGVLHRARQGDLRDVGRPDGPSTTAVLARVEAARTEHFPSSAVVRQVVELADGRSESVGESRSRWLVHLLGLGPCTPQFIVRDGQGFVARTDLRLDRWKVVFEFDGAGKYVDYSDLVAEKDREDRIRELGYEVVRIRWSDLARPGLLRRRILAAIARAEERAAVSG